MFIRAARAASVLIVSALALLGSPASAFAAWSAPVPERVILLGYGATYAGCVHRGVDLRAGAGEGVCSPVDGTVTFAGPVPADGGGTCTAVTIETADGQRVTLLPLSESRISSGCVVRAGEEIGIASAAGDSSSPEPHIHLSLRRGETYLDPTGLLPAPAATSAETQESPASTAEVQATPAAPVTSPGPAGLAAAPASALPSPAAPVGADAPAGIVPACPHSVRMPRDAQEARPLMLHSAPAALIRGFRLPSVVAAPPGLLLAAALAAMVALLVARALPRHALDRT